MTTHSSILAWRILMGRGTWWDTVHGVAQSQTQLKQLSTQHTHAGAGCHFLLQGIFLTQRSNPRLLHLLHCQEDSLPLVPPGKPLLSKHNLPRFINNVLKWGHNNLACSSVLNCTIKFNQSVLACRHYMLFWCKEPNSFQKFSEVAGYLV